MINHFENNYINPVFSGFWEWNFKTETAFISQDFRTLFGLDDGAVIDRPYLCSSLILKEDEPALLACFEEHIKSGGKIPFHVKSRYYNPDKSIFSAVCSGCVTEWDGDAKPVRMAGCHTSCLEDSLKSGFIVENADEFKTIFSLLPNLICTISREGYFTKLNSNWVDLLGYEIDELKKKPFIEFVHPEDLKATSIEVEKIISGQKTINFINRYIKKDGSEIWLEWNAVLSKNQTQIYASARDISIRKIFEKSLVESEKKLQEDQEKLQTSLNEKEILLRELYHRTKNNMQVICSMLLLQAYDTDDENVQNILGAMESRIHSMALIHQKLYQSGNLCNISTREYIVELAQMICENYGCNEKNISMSYDIDDFSLNIEYALPCGLILNELITNSLKHAFCRPAQEGGNIYLAFKKGPEREVFIKVSDDGHGAIKDFDPARNSKLGLQIILAIVEHQLEGSIVFENIKGFSCGITFKEKDIKSLYEIK